MGGETHRAIDRTMQLLGRTILALRILNHAARAGGNLVQTKSLCVEISEPKQYVSKIIYELKVGGFLETVRGTGGGIRLARQPEKIGVGDVVAYMEALEDKRSIERRASCPKRSIEPELEAAIATSLKEFISLLNAYTMADVIPDAPRTKRLGPVSRSKRVETANVLRRLSR